MSQEHLFPSQDQAPSAYELAEYERLSQEITARLALDLELLDRMFTAAAFCSTIAGLFLSVGGTLLSLGIQLQGAAIALLCYPTVLAFLAGMQEENDLRRGQIIWHLRTRHEARHLPDGWESRRHTIFQARPWILSRRDRARYHLLAPRTGMKVLSMRGLIITIQLLFLTAGSTCGYMALFHQPNLPLVGFVASLFVIALTLTLVTCFTIQHRRHRASLPDAQQEEGCTDGLEEVNLEEEHPFAPARKGIELSQ